MISDPKQGPVLAALLLCLASTASRAADPPIQIMVLGTFHMSNPGLDLHNVESADVRTPQRQRELQDVANALARFKPTVIALERVSTAPGYVDPKYAAFDVVQLTESRDERVQIGYRLARQLGLATVHGIDEQPAAGEPDYFPFDAVQTAAQSTGQATALQSLIDDTGRMVEAFGKRQATSSIAELLIDVNAPVTTADASFYYNLITLDAGESQPGAELLGYWYMRNAKIAAKLLDVARPGDRVLLLFGAGHRHWLQQILGNVPGIELVDPVPLLR